MNYLQVIMLFSVSNKFRTKLSSFNAFEEIFLHKPNRRLFCDISSPVVLPFTFICRNIQDKCS